MILRGARVALDVLRAERIDVAIDRGRFRVGAACAGGPELDCAGLLLLPGLINAHDHLEFSLFPRLGNGPYPNATEWARDIYRPKDPPVRELLAVPKAERLRWGGLKNLLSGATTVMHHNPWDAVFDEDFPVRVVRRYRWAHSLAYCSDFAKRYRETPSSAPFFMHACEGTDECAARELAVIEAAGALGRDTVIVHGVSADPGMLRRAGAALVWCPTSNLFTLGRTLDAVALESGVPVTLGTDSPMTAAGDLIDEMEVAAAVVGWKRVYEMVTVDAARILRLDQGEGEIRDGGVADFVAVRDRGATPAEALRGMRPIAVWISGEVRAELDESGTLAVEGRGRYRVAGKVPEIAPGLRLGGRQVSP